MDEDEMVQLLQELVSARGPSGEEAEVARVVRRELDPLCDALTVDAAGNIVGRIAGETPETGPAIRVLAHMDELALMVRKLEDEGALRVRPLGGMRPYKFGEGPVDIMADGGTLPGILSFGSNHVPAKANKVQLDIEGAAGEEKWANVYVTTRMTPEELAEAGVHPGTRIVLAQSRRQLWRVRDCVGGFFMDDRASLLVMILAARALRESGRRPATDVFLVATVEEEIGAVGGAYAARRLPGDIALAVDVAPVAEVYGTALTPEPVIVYADSRAVYDKAVSDRLLACGRALDMRPACATLVSYGSDASVPASYGQTARAALLCVACDNTHGFEVVPVQGLTNCARLLTAYLQSPSSA